MHEISPLSSKEHGDQDVLNGPTSQGLDVRLVIYLTFWGCEDGLCGCYLHKADI